MSRSFAADYAYGIKKEDELLPILNSKFNTIFKKQPKYASIDFTSGNIKIEQKARTNAYRQFSTTLIPASKLKTISDNDDAYFLFSFTDGDYIIQYDKDRFANYEIKPFVRHKRVDFNDKLQDYIYIPIEDLINLDELEVE
jgi:hypothetical protein